MCAIDCVLVGLDWAKPMMQFLLHIICSCILHAYVLFFQYTCYIWNVLELFWLSLSLPLFLFMLVVSMAQKRKSTPARNPLHSRTSSSSDSAPLYLRFRDDDAHKAFSENFSRRTFIRNAKSFWRTSPTPTFLMSFTVGDGRHCVTS